MEVKYGDVQENAEIIINTCLMKMKSQILTNKECVNDSSELIANKLIDEIILEVIADYHKAVIKGCDEVLIGSKSNKVNMEINMDSLPSDINVKSFKCPKCTNPVASDGFSRHLQYCIKRSTRNTKNSKEPSYHAAPSDDENYDSWNSTSEKSNSIQSTSSSNSKSLKRSEQKKKREMSRKNKRAEANNSKNKDDSSNASSGIDYKDNDSQVSKNETENPSPSPSDSNSNSRGSTSKKKLKQKYGSKSSKNKLESYTIELGSSNS